MRTRKPHSEDTKNKISISNTGKLSSQWKGDRAKYQALHIWIRTHHGKADHCSNKKCEGKSSEFQWALKSGKSYSRNVNDYQQMCRSCHRKMDMTKEVREKISKGLTKNKICSIAGCINKNHARTYCQFHYNKITRTKNI